MLRLFWPVNSQRQARNSYQKDLDKQYAALFQSCLDGDNTLVAARLQNNLQLKTESILASQRKDQEKEVDALKDKKVMMFIIQITFAHNTVRFPTAKAF